MRAMLRLPFSMVLALALVAAPAFAQVFTGRIDAEIRDASGAAMPGRKRGTVRARRTAPLPPTRLARRTS